jgi:hypothetical protein
METNDIAEAFQAALTAANGDVQLAPQLAQMVVNASSSADHQLPPGMLLIKAVAQFPEDAFARPGEFAQRRSLQFEIRDDRPRSELTYERGEDPDRFSLQPTAIREAVLQANSTLLALHQFTSMLRVPIEELLGLRNLSSLVSSVVVSEMQAAITDDVYVNPHQDGYPDLIARTTASVAYYNSMKAAGRLGDKSAWTDPRFGGIEVKATCGNTPPAKIIAKRGLGEMRADIISSFDWKAHHRETTRLLGTVWDFIDGVPTVVAAFYRNDLTEQDWGRIVSPKEGGGRTTSVSIMNGGGIAKMAEGWMVRTTDDVIRRGLENGRLLFAQQRIALLQSSADARRSGERIAEDVEIP